MCNFLKCLLLVVVGCSPGLLETGRFFSYPAGSAPHEPASYTYIGRVSIIQKSFSDEEYKNIEIWVKDKESNYLLNEQFKLFGASIESYITWNVFDTLDIAIVNYKNEDTLRMVRYLYNANLKKFVSTF